jgi:hypothetical protein
MFHALIGDDAPEVREGRFSIELEACGMPGLSDERTSAAGSR